MKCKNCDNEIKDARKAPRCSLCNNVVHKDCVINENGVFYCDSCYIEKDNQTAQIELTIPNVIRRTYIQTYKDCPYKFYLEVIKGYSQPENIYTKLGSDMHELFDKASQDKKYKKEDMLYEFGELWTNYDEKLFTSEELKEKMYQRAIDSIDTIYTIIPDMPEPFAIEKEIIFSIGDDIPKVSTTSDRIDKNADGLDIIDWKTGVVMVGQKLSTDLQAPLYIYGIREKYKLPVNTFTFYYLADNKIRVFERLNDDDYICKVNKREYKINVTDAIREVKTIFSHIKKGKFNIPRDTRKMYYTCKICHLREKEICKGAEVESWRQLNSKGA